MSRRSEDEIGLGLDTPFPEGKGADPKKVEAVKDSRGERARLLALFGEDDLPSSIMKADKYPKVDPTKDASAAGRSYDGSRSINKNGTARKMPEGVRKTLVISGGGCGAGALSVFPQNIGRTMVLLYSNPGDTVFDPFAGHNSRMSLTVNAGRHYIGCDLSADFMKFNYKKAEKLRKKHPRAKITLHHCDSRKVPVESELADFSLTSPPYFDIEYYGDEPEQLGKCKTYKDFLLGMGEVMAENFRVLKAGAFAAYFLNDFRRKGVFHSYHSDAIRLGRKVGFVLHDTMIVDLGRGFRDVFINQTVAQKILPKRHEYGLIFRKPVEGGD